MSTGLTGADRPAEPPTDLDPAREWDRVVGQMEQRRCCRRSTRDDVEQTLRGVGPEARDEVVGRRAGGLRAAREKATLVGGECGLGVATVRHQGGGELGAVAHGEVRALAGERRHQVGGVAEQGDPRDPVPPVPDRERVDGPRHERVVRLSDQREQPLVPALEEFQQRVGIEGCGRRHRDVDLQVTTGLAVADEPPAVAGGEHEAAAHQLGRRGTGSVSSGARPQKSTSWSDGRRAGSGGWPRRDGRDAQDGSTLDGTGADPSWASARSAAAVVQCRSCAA